MAMAMAAQRVRRIITQVTTRCLAAEGPGPLSGQ